MLVLFVMMLFLMGRRSALLATLGRRGTGDKRRQALEKFIQHLAAGEQLLDFQTEIGTLLCCQCERIIIAIL